MQSSGSAVDRIRPITLLGEGRSGQVFVGLDDVLRRRVVVKRLASGSFPSAATRNRLIAEARILSRIDHPGVPRIYDYAEQNEHDVFAIEFTEGPRLRDALAEGLDFAEKVRIATAVASALVVVHRNGVVHGALSPDSVAISKKGEVKIVDFHSTSVHLDGARSDPRWRSPEEAAGAEPTRESDMYCFGLLLQEMFGARDHDLRVLTASLLREAPSDRFTAAAALRRLQRLAGRRARRFRAAAIALLAMLFAFGGTKYTIDLQNERKAALAAQADAEQRRAQANDLVGFIIADIRPKLLSVGKLEIMEATSNKAFAYFGSIGPDEISPAEAAVNVRAFVQFTETEMLKNDLPAAEQSIRQGIALADAVLRRHPEAVELLFTRGTAHALYAMALDRKGDIPQAFVHARAFAETSNEVARRDPGNTNYVWHQAAAYSLLGTLYDRTGDIDASLRNIEISIDRQRQLLAVEGNDVARAQFFKTRRFAGIALIKLGRFEEARQRLEGGRAEIESELQRKPSNKELLDVLAGYNEQLAAIGLATGDLDAARRSADAQLAASKSLAAFDAAHVRWTLLVAGAQRSIGTAERMQGDVAAALRHHTAAIEAASAVLARDKEQTAVPRENAWNRIELARSQLAAGRARQASMQTFLAVDVLKTLRTDLTARRLLAEALLVRGEALAAMNDPGGANAAWEEALRVVEFLPSRPPDPRAADTHARVLLRLGRVERAIPLVEQLAALGYRNREFEALCREKGAAVNQP